MNKKLVRPKKGRVLFGVAQGLGEYFTIDPVIIRILFVILAIWGGSGILLYIIAIFLIPDEKNDKLKEEVDDIKKSRSTKEAQENFKEHAESIADEVRGMKKHNHSNDNIIFGLIVIVIGLIFLLSNIFSWVSWHTLWPIILIGFGLLIIFSDRNEEK
jgi:phage shock protein PspC (stress-responsive transcriptional regulator)